MENELIIARLESPVTHGYEPLGLKCPYCGIIQITNDRIPKSCEHIVFTYDWTNGEYIDVSPPFLKYLNNILKQRSSLQMYDRIDQQSIRAFLSEDIIPTPKSLRDWIQYLKLYETYTEDGGHGFIWGHASKRLLQRIKRHS